MKYGKENGKFFVFDEGEGEEKGGFRVGGKAKVKKPE